MSKLSDKITSGVVMNKEMVVVSYDFDGNVTAIDKIEYMNNKEYQTFLLKQKNLKEKLELEKKSKEELEKVEKEKELKKVHKERVLNAFDRWYRDVVNGLVLFDNAKYEEVINWYRSYLSNDDVEIHEELNKYL